MSVWVLGLVTLCREKWAIDVLRWLERESITRVGVPARSIQILNRRRKDRMFREIFRDRKRNQEIMNRKYKAAVTLTKVGKGFVTRMRCRRVAQKFLIKYIPPDGQPYWYNPSTQATKYEKPKILKERSKLSPYAL